MVKHTRERCEEEIKFSVGSRPMVVSQREVSDDM
jgi:hypothetical protein